MQDYDLQDDFIMDEIVSAPMAVRPEAVHTSRSDEKSEVRREMQYRFHTDASCYISCSITLLLLLSKPLAIPT